MGELIFAFGRVEEHYSRARALQYLCGFHVNGALRLLAQETAPHVAHWQFYNSYMQRKCSHFQLKTWEKENMGKHGCALNLLILHRKGQCQVRLSKVSLWLIWAQSRRSSEALHWTLCPSCQWYRTTWDLPFPLVPRAAAGWGLSCPRPWLLQAANCCSASLSIRGRQLMQQDLPLPYNQPSLAKGPAASPQTDSFWKQST